MEKDTNVNAGITQGQTDFSVVLDKIECRKGVAARFAAEEMDWMQVVLNGGPPCFHLCDDLHFCGRAKQWEGHGEPGFHDFTSLADLIHSARSDVPVLVKALRMARGYCHITERADFDQRITTLLTSPAETKKDL